MPTFNPNHSIRNWIFDGLIFCMCLMSPIYGLVISSHYVFFPDWPSYMTSLVPQQHRTWHVYVTFGMVYFVALQMIWAALTVGCIIIFTFGWFTWLVTDEYFCFPEQSRRPPQGIQAKQIWSQQRAIPAFRSFELFPFKYRELEIIILNFMEVFSPIIIPLQTAITILGIFCNVSLIKYNELLNAANTCLLLIWSGGGTTCALIALTFCGMTHNKSVRMLRTMRAKNWGSKERNSIMKRFVRSCKPLSYGYGRMYIIRKISVFKFMRHLTRGTFRCLLTLK